MAQITGQSLYRKTHDNPTWLHFGAGNLFRALPAALLQTLLDNGETDTGVIVASVHDHEPISRVLRPNGNQTKLVTLHSDGSTSMRELYCITEALQMNLQFERLIEIFESPSLQIVSFTITEKGYRDYYIWNSIARLVFWRALRGYPLAFVSFDNCSDNGAVLKEALLSGLDDDEKTREYINTKITFPYTMVDKITPHPSAAIAKSLSEEIIVTKSGGVHAAFVNTEESQYLVIEDDFPNGRPKLELGGANVFFTDRDTVVKAERMKVGACLNPLHTAIAIFGVLLGYEKVCEAVPDTEIKALISMLGYGEALPTAPNPGIIDPKEFLDAFINKRLPNPAIPDLCARIATDTSQKIAPRFGGILKYYKENGSIDSLTVVPLIFAGWLRYIAGTNDAGNPISHSPDPLLHDLILQTPEQILSNREIFTENLFEVGIGEKVLKIFREMSLGNGSIRDTLKNRLLKNR